jgi:hypothetical protein
VSPKIAVVIPVARFAPASDRPLDRLRASLQAVESQGIRVRVQDDSGVERSTLGGGWRCVRTAHPRKVSLVGAVCLAMQPQGSSDPEVAAEEALGVTNTWLVGVVDGWENAAPTLRFEDPDAAALYRAAVRCGHVLHVEHTVECPACFERRFPLDDDCKCTAKRRR